MKCIGYKIGHTSDTQVYTTWPIAYSICLHDYHLSSTITPTFASNVSVSSLHDSFISYIQVHNNLKHLQNEKGAYKNILSLWASLVPSAIILLEIQYLGCCKVINQEIDKVWLKKQKNYNRIIHTSTLTISNKFVYTSNSTEFSLNLRML